jgi:ParB family chromosome partitioning protein
MEGLTDILNSVASQTSRNSHVKKSLASDIDISKILPSKFQPRKTFDENDIVSLSLSIKQHGLINPITLRSSMNADTFEIVAGERRWRAARHLGWTTIPAIVKQMSDQDAQAVALVENLQREDLNPIEEACGYKELLEKHGLTHDQVAESVGKPRSTVSNFIRLLELDGPVQELLKHKKIEVGHAKLLVSLSKNIQGDLANSVASKSLSVRQLETLIKRTVFSPNSPKSKPSVDGRFKDISVFLKRKLGEDFVVCISKSSPNKISFSSEEALLKFIELLT